MQEPACAHRERTEDACCAVIPAHATVLTRFFSFPERKFHGLVDRTEAYLVGLSHNWAPSEKGTSICFHANAKVDLPTSAFMFRRKAPELAVQLSKVLKRNIVVCKLQAEFFSMLR